MKSTAEKVFPFLYCCVFLYALYCYNPFVLYFQNDDFIHIPLSRDGVLFQRNSFRPICDLSVMADYFLWGKNAVGYHFTNLLLHIICCLLVFAASKIIIEKYFKNKEAKRSSFLVTLLFFIHSSHSEAVFWILGRSAILGLIFSLLFLLQYLKREATLGSKAKYVLFLFLALLTYESSFVLPILSAILFFIDRKKKDSIHLLIVFASFFVYLITRWLTIGEIFGKYEITNVQQSLFSAVIFNSGKLLFRSFIPAYSQGILIVFLFAAVTGFLIVLFLKNYKLNSLITLFIVFILSLLPYVSLGIDAHGYEGERYLYFPLFFGGLLTVLIVQSLKNRLQSNLVILLILVVHCISLSVSASNFRFAGKINKMIINSVGQLQRKDTLLVYQLPQAQNGALIMRDGLPEAVSWLENNKFIKVEVRSKRSELLPLEKNYKPIYIKNKNDKMVTFYFSDSVLQINK